MSEAAPTLPQQLLALADRWPDRVALREKRLGVWRERSWSAFARSVGVVARALDAWGVGPGDAVAILSDNRTEWVFSDLATQALGAMAVGVYQTNPPDDVAYVVAHSGAKVLICEDQEQVDKAVAVAARTPAVERVVVIDPRGTRDLDDPRLTTWAALLEAGEAPAGDPIAFLRQRAAAVDPDTPTMVVYTSGTTGQPKGALLSARNVTPTGAALAALLELGPDDTVLSYLPLCHVAEKIFTLYLPLASGAVVHFGESIETVRDDLREVSPTLFLGVPRIWEKMHSGVVLRMKDSGPLKRRLFEAWTRRGLALGRKRRDGTMTAADTLAWRLGDLLLYRPLQERLGLRNCRIAVSGAAPIAPELIDWFHGIGVPVYEGFGMTECGGVSHMNRPGAFSLGSVGLCVPLVEHRLADDGEVLLRGPNVFSGYLHNPQATAESIDAEGWLHTGDVGAIDERGFLRITGRKKEILITAGGKNLSPEKIENTLKLSPYIKEAVAIGDRRKFISALLVVDHAAVGDWATRRDLPYGDMADLVSKPEVVALIEAELKRLNGQLARVESVRAFRLLPRELNQDDGELTATQKVRRRNVMEGWAELIESMYG